MSDEKKRHVVRVQAPDGTWHTVTSRAEWLALKARYDAKQGKPIRLQD